MPRASERNVQKTSLDEEILHEYKTEKELADRLRAAPRDERRRLYSKVYDEYFERCPLCPQLQHAATPEERATSVSRQMRVLDRFLRDESTFLEIGPGDCSLSIEVSKRVKQVYALDVSSKITSVFALPKNLEVILGDGCTVPMPEGSIEVVFSNQLAEHLHPDDLVEQLQSIYQSLARGGVYVCLTPNRLNGPHDISQHFDRVATGFHLREYTCTELAKIMKSVGFSRIEIYAGGRGHYVRISLHVIAAIEAGLELLPWALRAALARSPLLRPLLGIRIAGFKQRRSDKGGASRESRTVNDRD